MHDNFADWYREASVSINTDELVLRWKGIERFCETIDPTNTTNRAILLIKLFFGHEVDDESKEPFQRTFKEEDPAFPMRGNDFELRILSGATLYKAMEDEVSEFSTVIALGVLCGGFLISQSEIPIPDVVTMANDFLKLTSLRLRRQVEFETVSDEFEMPDFDAIEEALKANQIPQQAEILVSFFRRFTEWSFDSIDRLSRNNALVEEQLKIEQEETNMLWWLFTAVSRDTGQPMKEHSKEEVCLISAKELADLTEVIPGPSSIREFIVYMQSFVGSDSDESLQINDIVDSVDTTWRDMISLCDNLATDRLLPIHKAICMSNDQNDRTNWFKKFKKITGISGPSKRPASEIGMQFYRESLLNRIFHSGQ